MKFLSALIILTSFSLKGFGQHFLFNINYSHQKFYDSGTYNLKLPGDAKANLVNLGVSYKWRYFNIGVNANLGTIKNFKYEGSFYPKSNIIGANTFINVHFFKDERNLFVDPFLSFGYGFKSVSLNNRLSNYYQASYGVGFNFKITERVKISLSESFNLSFKNLYFNNLQTAVGLQWAFSKYQRRILPEEYENLNQKIKEDSVEFAKQIKEIEFKTISKQRKLRDSLEKHIELQKKTIEKLLKDKNTLMGSSVIMKSEIDQIRKNSWTEYEVYKLTADTLLKLSKLPNEDYACYTTTYLPEADNRKQIIAINGVMYICINPYNYYKICINANDREPLIPMDFLKYYPEAEVWKKE